MTILYTSVGVKIYRTAMVENLHTAHTYSREREMYILIRQWREIFMDLLAGTLLYYM